MKWLMRRKKKRMMIDMRHIETDKQSNYGQHFLRDVIASLRARASLS